MANNDKRIDMDRVDFDSLTNQASEKMERMLWRFAPTARWGSAAEVVTEFGHELAQPLSAISNYVHAWTRLVEQNRIGEAKTVAGELLIQVSLMSAIFNGYKRYIQTGATERDLHAPADIVQDAIRLVEWDAAKRGIVVRLDAPVSVPPLYVDRGLIQQVLLNLLRNAIEATPAEGDAVVVTLVERESAVEIKIRDHGQGLPHDAQPHVFERGFSTKPNRSGIGLALCRKIIDSHGGQLWFEAPGSGPGTQACVRLLRSTNL